MVEVRPTNAELALLRILWREGPSTVRAVHTVWEQRRVPAGRLVRASDRSLTVAGARVAGDESCQRST